MYKKKILTLVIIFVLLSVFSGCRLFGPTDKTKGELITPAEAEIHKGIKGISMEFLQGQPPSSVWEKTEFPITVKIKNEGAEDIQRGLLAITGNLYFSTVRDVPFSLEGKSQFNPEGEFSFEKFSAVASDVDEDKKDSFRVVACYQYRTYASATICINPRIIDEGTAREGECKVGSVSLAGGQGAPITITQVDETIIPRGDDELRLNLKIHVADKGGGRAVSYGSYMKDCGAIPLLVQEIGQIQVSDIRFSNYRLAKDFEYAIRCPNLDDNRFWFNPDGTFVIDCYADLDPAVMGSVSFTTPLTVELRYGYSQISEPKTITIRNSLVNE